MLGFDGSMVNTFYYSLTTDVVIIVNGTLILIDIYCPKPAEQIDAL
jgi:hypothetical protein